MKAKVDYGLLNSLQEALAELPKAVAEEGRDNAHREYQTNSVYVGTEKNGDTSEYIVAKGFTMPFEEYGAGILAIADVVDGVVVGEDTWSVKHKQEYHRWGYWTHNGQTYYYIRPKYAMHRTVTHLKTSATKVAMNHFRRFV